MACANPGLSRRSLRRVLGSAAAAGALLLLEPPAARAAEVFAPDASSNGRGVDELFWLATGLTGVAFALVVAILVYAAVAFRARPGRAALYETGEGRRARLVTGIFAIAVFVGLDVVLAVKDHSVWNEMYGDRKALAAGDGPVVQVLAKQFEWLFRYPGKDGKFGTEDDVRTQLLRVPDDRPTLVRLRSIDVVHSFFLPNFRTKQDVVPGMTTTSAIHPRPGAVGEYEIACAELCGMAHYRMRGRLLVMPRAEFDAWMASQERDIERFGPQTQGEEFWAQYDRRTVAEAPR